MPPGSRNRRELVISTTSIFTTAGMFRTLRFLYPVRTALRYLFCFGISQTFVSVLLFSIFFFLLVFFSQRARVFSRDTEGNCLRQILLCIEFMDSQRNFPAFLHFFIPVCVTLCLRNASKPTLHIFHGLRLREQHVFCLFSLKAYLGNASGAAAMHPPNAEAPFA